jgi:hypothetical protein
MTAILCRVDPAKGELRYVNAGHPAGRLAGPGGLERIEAKGPPAGTPAQRRPLGSALTRRPGVHTVGDYAIHILVKNGNVTLAGMVDNVQDRDVAGIRANSVSGAFSVTNDLQVAGHQTAGR